MWPCGEGQAVQDRHINADRNVLAIELDIPKGGVHA
jgi:hypothetical protein